MSTIDAEQLQLLIEVSIALYRATLPPKPVKAVTKQKPIPPKSFFPHPKSQVTRIASPSGPDAELPQLKEPTLCGWHQGQLKKYLPKESNPYVIRWAVKPAIEMQVSEKIIRQLVINYKYCDENDIFKGIVGKELLWVVRNKAANYSLRFVKVLRFPTKGSRLFELAFHDGNTMEITPEDLDRAFVRDERIRNGKAVITNFTDLCPTEVSYTLAHMNNAEQEKVKYPISRSVNNPSKDYGSDFSSSPSQDGDMSGEAEKTQKGTLQGKASDDRQITATALHGL